MIMHVLVAVSAMKLPMISVLSSYSTMCSVPCKITSTEGTNEMAKYLYY